MQSSIVSRSGARAVVLFARDTACTPRVECPCAPSLAEAALRRLPPARVVGVCAGPLRPTFVALNYRPTSPKQCGRTCKELDDLRAKTKAALAAGAASPLNGMLCPELPQREEKFVFDLDVAAEERCESLNLLKVDKPTLFRFPHGFPLINAAVVRPASAKSTDAANEPARGNEPSSLDVTLIRTTVAESQPASAEEVWSFLARTEGSLSDENLKKHAVTMRLLYITPSVSKLEYRQSIGGSDAKSQEPAASEPPPHGGGDTKADETEAEKALVHVQATSQKAFKLVADCPQYIARFDAVQYLMRLGAY